MKEKVILKVNSLLWGLTSLHQIEETLFKDPYKNFGFDEVVADTPNFQNLKSAEEIK